MKHYRYTYFVIFALLILAVGSLLSFDQKQDKEAVVSDFEIPPLVQKELTARLEKYKQTIIDKCMKEAIEDAEFYIDSLVAEELKFQARDTLKFPAKPRRPQLREPIILNDSTEIAPIIKK